MKLFTGGLFSWKKSLTFILFVNSAVIVTIFLSLSKIPPIVPLYYGNPTGVEQLGPVNGLFIPPGFVLVVLLTSILITKAYKDEFLESMLILSCLLLTVLSTITVLKIMMLVGSF